MKTEHPLCSEGTLHPPPSNSALASRHVLAHDDPAAVMLIGQMESLLTLLRAARTRLLAKQLEHQCNPAELAVTDTILPALLNALNRYEPALLDRLAAPTFHPELIYREWVQLAGTLLIFSQAGQIESIPGYDHRHLEGVFPPLFSLLRTLLAAILPTRMLPIELKPLRHNQWQGELTRPALKEMAGLYLAVCASLPQHQIQTIFPTLCRVGVPAGRHTAAHSVPLLPLNHIPVDIPLRLENHYFAFDMNHPAAHAMLHVGNCVISVPKSFGDVKLELFALLR